MHHTTSRGWKRLPRRKAEKGQRKAGEGVGGRSPGAGHQEASALPATAGTRAAATRPQRRWHSSACAGGPGGTEDLSEDTSTGGGVASRARARVAVMNAH